MKVSELLIAALRQVGAVQKHEAPPADEMADALSAANIMLDGWSGENLMLVASILENFPILKGVSAYSVGVGQTMNTAKPLIINNAFVRDSNNLDYQLDIISRDEWDGLLDKAVTSSMPEALFYDRGSSQQATQTGTINIYNIPDKNYTLFIDSQKAFTDIVNITDNFTFEGPYERAFKFNLAIELWGEYHGPTVPIPVHILSIAEATKAVIKRLNRQRYIAATDLPGGRKGQYNILTDSYTR